MASLTKASVAQQKDMFIERLNRIEKGGRYTSQHVYCGPEDEIAALQNGGEAAKVKFARPKSERGFFGTVIGRLIAAPMSVAIAVLSVIAARVLRVSFFGGGLVGENAGLMFAYDLGIALALVLVLRLLFRLSGTFQWLTVATMAIVLFTMHNFVHGNPELFATLFTQGWVQGVLDTTRDGTLLIAGKTFSF